MKSFHSLSKIGRRPFLALTGLLLCQGLVLAATLTVTPAAISHEYAGMVTLAITGLTNGETVTMDKFLDANANGVIDGGDILGQRFQLIDGQVSLIGGETNVNVPGDFNPVAGNITTPLSFESINVDHIVGRYLFKLSSPTARFTPLTNTLTITNAAYLQSFTGQVRSNGTASAVANAMVVVLGTNQHSKNFVGGTVADSAGNYTFQVAPGTYQVAAFKSNFVGDFTAPPITLGAGVTLSTNLNAIAATRSIAGRVADAGSTNTPLPGVMLFLQSANGLVALSFTGTNGAFNAPVTAGVWNLSPEEQDAALHGYVRLQSSLHIDTSTGSVSGVNLLLPKATAMFYGSIKDDLGNPLPGYDFYANDQDTYQYESSGVSDAGGNYAVAVLAGNWYADLRGEDPRLTNYVYSGNIGTTLVSDGQALRHDFMLRRATNHITGYLRDNLGNPIGGVRVYAHAEINGSNFSTADALTDGAGNYSLNVATGTWQVGLSCGCNDCDNTLGSMGYQCVSEQSVTLSGNNGVANFIAQSCGALQVATASLPGGLVGSFYMNQVQAAGCQMPFQWSLSPGSGSLPSGLNLSPDGTISGFPDTAGTYNFSVRVADNTAATADQGLSINIVGVSLEVTTASLPNGALNTFYNQSVSATGGQSPYSWSLAPGSAPLPPGLTLSSGGTIIGTPTNSGTFFFNLRVTDAMAATAENLLSISIPTLPLQITTLTLSNAQQGAAYTNHLQAFGGLLPYTWSIAPGSLSLPPNLNLASGGVISGTPATNGTFFFIVRVTDANSSFVNRSLGLTINAKPTLTTLNRIGNQFQLLLAGATGQNYTVQFSTNLAGTNWFPLLTTNPAATSITILDPNATNSVRYYRARVGP